MRARKHEMTDSFLIHPFAPADQARVEKLVLTIQCDEFALDLSADNQPDLKDIKGFFSGEGSAFWVAVADGQIVGCIGLQAIDGCIAAMRKFMVHQDWRGRELGVAKALNAFFTQHARAIGATTLALSTVHETKAAQAFYRRAGYRDVTREDMPAGFVPGIIDVVFMLAVV